MFTYNNAKNLNINYLIFELNCIYYSYISYQKNVNSCFEFKSAKKLLTKLKNLMIICQNYFHYTQKLENKLIIRVLNIKAIFLVIKFA